jgi:LuxR family maltose regulon positive regulatory protein
MQARGDGESARDLIRRAEHVAREGRVASLTWLQILAYHVRLRIRQGDVEAAARWAADWARRDDGTLAEDGFSFFVHWIEQTTAVRVLIAQGAFDRADSLISPLIAAAESGRWTWILIELLALHALARQGQGRTEAALAAVDRALALAEPEGFVRLFVDEGEPMAALLRQAAARSAQPAYARRLLEAFGEPFSPPFSAAPALIESLSERELDVLRLIAQGMTNREIAEALVVAISTVKTHVNNLYRKLDVSNRVQAAARARNLGLL